VIPEVLEGAPAQVFELTTAAGDTILVPRPGRATVLVAVSSRCPYSERSLEALSNVARRVCDVDIVLASAEPDDAFVAYWRTREFDGCADVIAGSVSSASHVQSAYEISGTPQLFVIDDDGKIRRVWYGLIEGRRSRSRLIEGVRSVARDRDARQAEPTRFR
jgi:hypothetical protein